MTAEEFFHKFKAQIPSDYKVEDYYNSKQFTKDIIDIINGIIKGEKYKSNKEYYRIDCIGWSETKAKLLNNNPKNFKLYSWNLDIAVEHENNSNEWMDEVVKLSYIYCPLRIIIGYVPYGESQKDRLNCVAKSLKKMNSYDNMKTGEFLIILGNSSIYKKKERMFGYRGYLFNPEKGLFEEIN